MISHPNRCETVELINQAITAGATQAKACESLGFAREPINVGLDLRRLKRMLDQAQYALNPVTN